MDSGIEPPLRSVDVDSIATDRVVIAAYFSQHTINIRSPKQSVGSTPPFRDRIGGRRLNLSSSRFQSLVDNPFCFRTGACEVCTTHKVVVGGIDFLKLLFDELGPALTLPYVRM